MNIVVKILQDFPSSLTTILTVTSTHTHTSTKLRPTTMPLHVIWGTCMFKILKSMQTVAPGMFGYHMQVKVLRTVGNRSFSYT